MGVYVVLVSKRNVILFNIIDFLQGFLQNIKNI